jgi:heptosyltransferase II
MTNFSSIIVRMPNWIGDLVMATPVLFALKKANPEAKLTVMVKNPLGEVLLRDPHIDELFRFDKPSFFGRRDERRGLIEKLRQGKYDLGVLLTNSFSSAWWFWQGHIVRRIGYAMHSRSLLLTDAIPLPKNVEQQHLVLTYQQLLEPLGIPLSSQSPKLYLSQEEIETAKQMLGSLQVDLRYPLIGINPGAAYGSAKCWLPERFREVAKRLVEETEATILFFGDRAGTPLVKEICRDLPPRVVNLAGATSLRDLMALISLCQVLLTNDSGPMHIACALGVDVVALFGSTDEVATGPYNNGTVIHKHVSCSPCFKRTCPIDFRCMKGISTEEVVMTILKKHKKTQPAL